MTSGLAAVLAYWSRSLSQSLQEKGLRVQPLDRQSLGTNAFAVFDEWLDRTLPAIPASMRVLVCWDEYEKLQQTLDAGWGGQLLDYLRHLLQHRPRIVPLFTGVRTFEEQGPAWTARFVNARRIRVGRLARDEVVPLLDEFAAPPTGIYAVFPQRKYLPLRVRLLIDHLKHSYGNPDYWKTPSYRD